MALPQAYQADSNLHKVGLEDFALLDEYFKPVRPPARTYGHQYHNNKEFHSPKKAGRIASQSFDPHHREYGYGRFQDGYIYRGSQIWLSEPVIDSNQAAQLYGGKVIVDHGIGNKIRKGYY